MLNGVRVQVSGTVPSHQYQLQRSTDLQHWQTVQQFYGVANRPYLFTDQYHNPTAFYRAQDITP